MCGKDKGHKSEHSIESSAVNGNARSHITSQHHYLKGKIRECRLRRVKHTESPFCKFSHADPEKQLCLSTNIILLSRR